jgi:hypothetical protein
MKLVHTVHNWYLIILGCVTKVKAYKINVYVPSLMMKVPDHVYVLG